MADASGQEFTLKAGELRATVSTLGASLRRLWRETPGGPREVLWGYSGTGNKKGGQGDVLVPFPGRVRDGAYSFAGKRHRLERNDKEGPNAIHGFLRNRVWQAEQEGAMARFAARIEPEGQPGFPFALDVVVGYELLPTGLACAFVVHNVGSSPAPVGVGFHPYLLVEGGVDEALLEMPASKLVEFDGLLPTGRVLDVPLDLDFRRARKVGSARLNHCFTGLGHGADGFTRIRVGALEVWMGPAFSHVVLYTGDALGKEARRALAVEPMTCATDALNHPDWGLRNLASGEAFSGTWGIRLP